MSRRRPNPGTFLVLALGLALWGCAAGKAFDQGRRLAEARDWDRAVYFFSKALALDPANVEYRKALDIAKVKASQQHLELAKSYLEAGALDLAIIEYQVATTLDPTNSYAADSLVNSLERKRELETRPTELTDIERFKEETRGTAGPILHPGSDAPLTLTFPPNTKVKDIYTALGKAAGINVLFDSGIRDQETFSIDIANISFRKALEQVAIANRHFYKIIDERTIMVVPDNPQKRRDYEDHVIKTFYLSNANPNDVVNTLRGLLDARRIATNTSLNAITIRDTPAKIDVMERVIEANDKPPSEVVIDVEVLEVRKSSGLFYGTRLSTYEVQQTLEQPDEVNGVQGLRVSSIPFINQSDWLLTIPDIFYRAEQQEGNIRTLARPSLRALDGKQVTLRLGDQVPIETSTFSAVAGGTVPLTRNFQFRDIGINIDITPRVHHNNEVTLMLQVELTNVGEDPDGSAGPVPPTFGNRRINTEIRLKDGETNLLAGLFTSQEETSRAGLPVLSDIPVLREIFASNSKVARELDIVLTLTPHIVRTPNIRREDLEAFYVGTESNVGGVSAVAEGGAAGRTPFATATPPPSPRTVPRPVPPGAATPPPLPGQPIEPEPGSEPPPGIESGENPFLPGTGEPSPTSVLPREDAAEPVPVPAATPPPPGPQGAAEPERALVPATVSLSPPSAVVAPGEEVAVQVVVSGAVDVSHAPFWLTFDPAVVEVLGLAEGDFLSSDGNRTHFLSSVQAGGRVVVGLSRIGRVPGVGGSGVLATVRLRGVAAGTSPLTFLNATLRDAASRPLPASFVPGSVAVP